MKLELGKRYVSRNGNVFVTETRTKDGLTHGRMDTNDGRVWDTTWLLDGKRRHGSESPWDLVSEHDPTFMSRVRRMKEPTDMSPLFDAFEQVKDLPGACGGRMSPCYIGYSATGIGLNLVNDRMLSPGPGGMVYYRDYNGQVHLISMEQALDLIAYVVAGNSPT